MTSIIEQAIDIVERQLAILEVSVESRRALQTGKYTCQCRACRYARERATEWLAAMRAQDKPTDIEAEHPV